MSISALIGTPIISSLRNSSLRTIIGEMPGELTTTEAAVLALLEMEGERSRYDLMKFVSQAIGYVWAPAKTQLYALLPKLAERGLVSSRATRDGARPEKRL